MLCCRGVGFPAAASTQVPSIVSDRHRRLRGIPAASCFTAARKRVQLWPTAARTPSCCPQPWERAGPKDTGSLVRSDPTSLGLGPRLFPQHRSSAAHLQPSLGSNRGGGERGTAESARGSPCSWTRRRFAQEHALVGSSRCTLRPAASISSRSTEQFRSGLGAKSCQAGRMEGRGGGWRQHVEPGGTWPRTRLPADRGAAREPRGLRDATPGELRGAARRARGPGHRRHAGRPHGTR